MRRLIFHLAWIYSIAQLPGDAVRSQGLTPSMQKLYFDPEIEAGDSCIDDDGSEIFTNTARG